MQLSSFNLLKERTFFLISHQRAFEKKNWCRLQKFKNVFCSISGCPIQHDQKDFAVLSRWSCFDVVSGVYSKLGVDNTV